MSVFGMSYFPELADITDEYGKKIVQSIKQVDIPAGVTVFSQGEECQQYLLVCKGSVKVMQSSVEGREIVLYRVQDTESCVLTTSCLLSDTLYTANGVTETAVTALLVPASDFRRGLQHSQPLRDFIFKQYSKRLGELLHLVNALAFECLDVRLAQCLLTQAENGQVSMTHQALASEIGSTREVISRRLKEFEHLGWVKLHRGMIDICNTTKLSQLKS